MGVSAAVGLASAGLGVVGKLAGGQASKLAGQLSAINAETEAQRAEVRAESLRIAADAGRVRGTQVDTAYREELADIQETFAAVRSSQNVGFDSPTSQAIYAAIEQKNARERRVAVSNELVRALGLDADAIGMTADAKAKRAAGMQALIGAREARSTALLKAGPDLLKMGELALTTDFTGGGSIASKFNRS